MDIAFVALTTAHGLDKIVNASMICKREKERAKNGAAKRKQNGRDARRPADSEHVAADDSVDAGAGAVQYRGQRVRQPRERGGADGGFAELPGSEPDDRSGHRHGRGRERAAVPRAGREGQRPRQPRGRERRVPRAGGLRRVPDLRPVRQPRVYRRADLPAGNHPVRRGLSVRGLLPVLRPVRSGHVRAPDAGHRPHDLHHVHAGCGRDHQHHPRSHLYLQPRHGREGRGHRDGHRPDRGVHSRGGHQPPQEPRREAQVASVPPQR